MIPTHMCTNHGHVGGLMVLWSYVCILLLRFRVQKLAHVLLLAGAQRYPTKSLSDPFFSVGFWIVAAIVRPYYSRRSTSCKGIPSQVLQKVW